MAKVKELAKCYSEKYNYSIVLDSTTDEVEMNMLNLI